MPGNAPMVTDEHDQLLAFLAHQRLMVRTAGYGLTDEQARLAPTTGPLSVGGLIKHTAATERGWMDIVLQRERPPLEEFRAQYELNYRLGPDETLADVFAMYDEIAAETESIVSGLDLNRPVPIPPGVPWFPQDIDAWSVRWVLLHLIEEAARHAGHADIVREAIDGATAISLLAAAEDWPATPWIQPWQPARADG